MYEYNAKVIKWVDGDTVDVDIDLGFGIIYANQRIRLHGINAPETRTRDLAEKEKGLIAKEYVNRMAPVGSEIILKTHLDKKGKFGRILGEVLIHQERPGVPDTYLNLNSHMLQEGIVRVYGAKA